MTDFDPARLGPAPGARVAVGEIATVTGDDGRFRISVPPGTVALVVSAEGSGERTLAEVEVLPGHVTPMRIGLVGDGQEVDPHIVEYAITSLS